MKLNSSASKHTHKYEHIILLYNMRLQNPVLCPPADFANCDTLVRKPSTQRHSTHIYAKVTKTVNINHTTARCLDKACNLQAIHSYLARNFNSRKINLLQRSALRINPTLINKNIKTKIIITEKNNYTHIGINLTFKQVLNI